MSNPGPKYNFNQTSPVSIVRHGFTREMRIAVARREQWLMAALRQNYTTAVINEICQLCDAFAAKHGTWSERHG